MNRLELVAYYSAGYKFLKQHSFEHHLAAGPTEPWRRLHAIADHLDHEITSIIAAMLLDGEGCAQVEGESSQIASIQ